jgi:tetratricopeptide (TPR) repeat protein
MRGIISHVKINYSADMKKRDEQAIIYIIFSKLEEYTRGMKKHYLLATVLLLLSSALHASAGSEYQLGLEAYKTGNIDAAVRHFESARDQGLNSVTLQYNLASSYYRAGRYAESKEYFSVLNQTEAMRDIAEYHLGMIAVTDKDISRARDHFSTVISRDTDKKLVALSEKQLNILQPKEDRWRSHAAFNLGYDDNISSVSGDSVLDIADSFYELLISTDLLLAGKRKDGWTAEAGIYGVDYSETDTNDQYQFTLGLKRRIKLADWDTSALINVTKSTYAGDDFQQISKLDIVGRKLLTKRDHVFLRYQVEDIKSENPVYDYLEGWRQRARAEYRNYSEKNIKHIYYELELNDRGNLVTLIDEYEYSPTRHTIRGTYTQVLEKRWWIVGDISYRYSEFEPSSTIDRQDDQWKVALSVDYHYDKTLKFGSKYLYIDNTSSVDRYSYDKSIITIGLSKLF